MRDVLKSPSVKNCEKHSTEQGSIVYEAEGIVPDAKYPRPLAFSDNITVVVNGAYKRFFLTMFDRQIPRVNDTKEREYDEYRLK